MSVTEYVPTREEYLSAREVAAAILAGGRSDSVPELSAAADLLDREFDEALEIIQAYERVYGLERR